MAAVVFGILKILGLIVLAIVGVLLAAVLLVLFAPVRYRAKGSWHGKFQGEARLSWLFPLVSVRASYQDGLKTSARILWFRLGGSAGEEEAAEKAGEEAETADEDARGAAENQADEDAPEAAHKATDPNNVQIPVNQPADEGAPNAAERSACELDQKQISQDLAARPQKRKRSCFEWMAKLLAPVKKFVSFLVSLPRRVIGLARGIWAKILDIPQRISHAGKHLMQNVQAALTKKDQILDFLRDPENRKTFALAKRQLGKLMRHLRPRKGHGQIRFGFDDPYTTGQILTYISPFYGYYGTWLQVIPVFEEPVLEGEFSVRGRVRIATVLAIFLRMMYDQNFRRLLKQWRS